MRPLGPQSGMMKRLKLFTYANNELSWTTLLFGSLSASLSPAAARLFFSSPGLR
jgi:hypothetical protein